MYLGIAGEMSLCWEVLSLSLVLEKGVNGTKGANGLLKQVKLESLC